MPNTLYDSGRGRGCMWRGLVLTFSCLDGKCLSGDWKHVFLTFSFFSNPECLIHVNLLQDHPNIVRLEEVYESHNEIYLVQEVCKGGELFDRLDEQPDYHYTEAQCARLVKQMLCSVRYIHNKGIIHRDLKLENFLFSDLDAKSELKMIDFGLSKHFQFGEIHVSCSHHIMHLFIVHMMHAMICLHVEYISPLFPILLSTFFQHEAVGTPYTVAPEVIRGSYDERCDVWAIGVITYLLLSGGK